MKMFRLSAKTRISLGLVCMLMSVLSTAMMLGIVPERESAVRQGRGNLCEALALVSSEYITRGEMRRLDQLLAAAVERNDDLLSVGVRQTSAGLVSSFGNHEESWPISESNRSTGSHVRVPIRSGGDRWGFVELCFQPLRADGWLGTLRDPWMLMSGFICVASFVLFQLYLKKMLAHLDPSKTVPKRVRTALDSLAEGLLVLDRQSRVVLANQSFAEWVGRDADKLLGRKAGDLGWKTDSLSRTPWQEAITNESVVAGSMMELCLPDQPTRMLIANASPVLGSEGKCRGVLVSFDDVTQLEETKRDLTVAKRAADDANQAKSDFLARMSHEIRTPMNAILGYTDVLRRGFDTSVSDRQEYLDTIHGSGEHLLALINDILDLSKVESGQMELDLGPCSPYGLIKEVVSLLQSKADEKGISISYHNQGLLPRTIQGDSVRLRQAIMNLTGNAIKFTDVGGVQIVARIDQDASRVRSDHNMVLAIDVIDSGIGIAEQSQARIFEPFAQADTSITRRFGGTGLGLAISKQLAEAMGGDITLQSVPGKGTTFTIHITIGSVDELEMIDPVMELSTGDHSHSSRSQVKQLPACRILVADDGSPNRKLLQLVLGKAGATVVAVENGQMAVDTAMEQSFDVILMDMQMPVMDGYEATRTLRQSGYERPIYALTANAMQGDQEKCYAAGCSGFLTKPIKIDHLLQTMAEELNGRTNLEMVMDHDSGIERPVADTKCETLKHTESTIPMSMIDEPVHCSFPLDDPDYLEIAEDFVQSLRTRLPRLNELLGQADFDRLAMEAHWMKGVSASAGFTAFSAPACALEQQSKVGDLEGCRTQIDRLFLLASRIDLPASVAASPLATPALSESCNALQLLPSDPKLGKIESTLPMDDVEYREIVIDFLDRLGARLTDLENAIEQQQWTEAASLAHWLRGTSGTVGYPQFCIPTRALEQFAETGDQRAAQLVMQDIQGIAGRIVIPVA